MSIGEVEPTETMAGVLGSAEALAVRSAIYVVLARGFSFPHQSAMDFLKRCGETGSDGDGGIGETLRALFEVVKTESIETLQGAYVRLFDPVAGIFPYESEMKNLRDFSKVHLMADIMGFYQAFGVQPSNERPDHISSELEFMHYLTLKESYALRKRQMENAAVCRSAREKFFSDHVMTWTDALLEALRARAGEDIAPFYAHVMDLLQLFVETEKEEIK